MYQEGEGVTTATKLSPLTNRETEVLKLLSEGMSNCQIKGALFIVTRTVEHHIGNIFDKLGLRGGCGNARVLAARIYWEAGL